MDQNTWESIRKNAKRKSDNTFATQVSNLTRLKSEEVLDIAPTPIEREKFAELMAVVTDNAISNHDKAEQLRNVQGLAEIAVSFIDKVV